MGVAGSPADAVVQRLGEMEAEMATLVQRISELEGEMVPLRESAVDLDHVTATLADFDGLWDVLLPAERSRLVHVLVERVKWMPANEISVVFRAAEFG